MDTPMSSVYGDLICKTAMQQVNTSTVNCSVLVVIFCTVLFLFIIAEGDDSVLMRVGGLNAAFSPVASAATIQPPAPLTDAAQSSLSELYAKDQASPTAFEFKTDVAFSSPTVVGWEPNDRGKPGPRVSDLGAVMNSEKLMEQAVDLNVRLMKWRQWPSLDTESLSGLKCLLLGAGTLGCATARALMGWGIRHITLVDNGRVSYSNPARQSLFEFEDAENKAFKSVAAAQRLKKIFPGMVTAGHVLTIAMPGHPIDAMEETSAQKSFEELRDLVASHDVVYALTDSREARWLPSVLCAAMDKLLINSALGFSSYLVMRHGGAPLGSAEKPRPGCYFCNDVVAPVDSMKDRSLDQQCTVTRPGLALIAGGLASELTVALMNSPHKLHHPLPAFRRAGDTDFAENSDEIPHQIRGSLNNFTQACPVVSSFFKCLFLIFMYYCSVNRLPVSRIALRVLVPLWKRLKQVGMILCAVSVRTPQCWSGSAG